MAEPYTLGEIDTFRRVLPADARWVATVDARDAEIERLRDGIQEALTHLASDELRTQSALIGAMVQAQNCLRAAMEEDDSDG